MSVQLDLITYQIELDILDSGAITLNLIDGGSVMVLQNGTRVGSVNALDFRTGNGIAPIVTADGGRIRITHNLSNLTQNTTIEGAGLYGLTLGHLTDPTKYLTYLYGVVPNTGDIYWAVKNAGTGGEASLYLKGAGSNRALLTSDNGIVLLATGGGIGSTAATTQQLIAGTAMTLQAATGITSQGSKHSFTPAAGYAGLNVGSLAGNPSSLANGDLWYNSSSNELNARINGATVALGAGGGSDFWKITGTTTLTGNVVIDGDEDNHSIILQSGLSTAQNRLLIDPSGSGTFQSLKGSFNNSFITTVPTDDFSTGATLGTYEFGVSSSNPDFSGILFGGDYSANYTDESATSVRYVQAQLSARLNVANPAYTGTLSTGTLSYSDTDILAYFQKSVNSYAQAIIQNTNVGAAASADLVFSPDNGTATDLYGNIGVNSSGWSGTGPTDPANAFYFRGKGIPIAFGTTGNHAVTFFTGGEAAANVRYSISGTGVHTRAIPITGSSWTGGFTGSGVYDAYSPTLTASANSQELVLMDLNPTFVPGAFTTLKQTALRVRSGTAVFGKASQVNTGATPVSVEVHQQASSFNSLTLFDEGGTIATQFRGNSLYLGSTTGPRFSAAGDGNSAPGGGGVRLESAISGTNNAIFTAAINSGGNSTSTQVNRFYNLTGSITPTSGAASWSGLDIGYTINQTGTASGNFYGIRAIATITALLGQWYPFISSGNGKHGFNQLTPTAIVHVTGAGTTTGSTFLVENSAGTDRFEILDNGQWNVSGAAGTAGQVLTSGGAGATPTWYASLTLGASTITIADAIDVVLNATTGTKWGTATSQKQGWWNATPIVQPTTGIAGATFVANASANIVYQESTFDGYKLEQIVKALRNMGKLA